MIQDSVAKTHNATLLAMDRLCEILYNFLAIKIIKMAKFLRIEKKNTISDIFQSDYYYVHFFLTRISYRLDEYEDHRIPMTYRRFKSAIFITLNGLCIIITLTLYVCMKESKILINYKYLEEIINIQRLDIIIICTLCMVCIGELISLRLLFKVVTYKSPMHDIVMKNLQFNDQRLTSNHLRYLHQYYLFLKTIGAILSVIIFLCIILGYVSEISLLVWSYFENKITFIQLLTFMTLFFSVCFHFDFMITALLLGTITAGFISEFLKLRSKQLSQFLQLNHLSKQIPMMKFKWNHIHQEYVDLYEKTAAIDKTISFVLLYLESASKIASISACIFYSRQIRMGISNSIVLCGMLLVFVYTSVLYTRLTYSPTYNHQYCQSLLKWMAKRSIIRNKTKKQFMNAMVKSNLFLQTMTQNEFGFHCGQVFFITKFQVLKLFMMHLPLITMFYKKICMV